MRHAEDEEEVEEEAGERGCSWKGCVWFVNGIFIVDGTWDSLVVPAFVMKRGRVMKRG